MYVRVKDPTSGHQFDRPAEDPLIADGTLVPLNSKRWPPADQARPPLFHTSPVEAAPTDAGAQPETPETAHEENMR